MIDDGWEPVSDYDDQMDGVRLGLLSYEDTHCEHGTFTGSWAGPDYMCGPCEMGTTYEEWTETLAYQAQHAKQQSLAREMVYELVSIPDETVRTLAVLAWAQTKDWRYYA